MNGYRHRLLGALVFTALMSVPACSGFETAYFKDRVNEVTQDHVVRRYGAPHRMEQAPNGRSVWTYFDRGSGTSGYSGYARSSFCQAYVLTFDEDHVLRDWRLEDCSGQTKPVTEPSSDRTQSRISPASAADPVGEKA